MVGNYETDELLALFILRTFFSATLCVKISLLVLLQLLPSSEDERVNRLFVFVFCRWLSHSTLNFEISLNKPEIITITSHKTNTILLRRTVLFLDIKETYLPNYATMCPWWRLRSLKRVLRTYHKLICKGCPRFDNNK